MKVLGQSLRVGVLLFLTAGCDVLALLRGNGEPLPENCLRADYQLQATDRQVLTAEILATARTIIENRVDATGQVPNAVRAIAPDRISVVTPVIDGVAEFRRLIGQIGVFEFVPVPPAFFDTVVEGQPLPSGMPVTLIFATDQIAAARPGQTQAGLPAMDVDLKPEGARLLDEHAAGHLGESFAIVLDGTVLSAPIINAPRFDGRVQISGALTASDVNLLVTLLRFGALPLHVEQVEFVALSCVDAGL